MGAMRGFVNSWYLAKYEAEARRARIEPWMKDRIDPILAEMNIREADVDVVRDERAILFRRRGRVISRLILLFDREGRPSGYHGPIPEDEVPPKEPRPTRLDFPRELEAFRGRLRSWIREHRGGHRGDRE